MVVNKNSKSKKRRPVTKLPVFIEVHRERYETLVAYATTKWGQDSIDDLMLQRLLRRSAIHGYAVNSHARIAYARAAKREFERLFARHEDTSFHFLTFAPEHFSETLEKAVSFREADAKFWMNCALSGFDYIGFVEPPFYSNWPPGTTINEKMAHWHFHIVIWNCSAEKVDLWVEHANRFFCSMLPGLDAAHVRHVSANAAFGKALYAMKAPLSDYRVYPIVKEEVDPTTGEVFKTPTGKYRQKKQLLRPGDAAKMCKLLGARTISNLLLSGGEGEDLARRIENKAHASLERAHAARKQRFNGPRYSFRISQNA